MTTRFLKFLFVVFVAGFLSGCGTIDELFRSDRSDVVVVNADGSTQSGTMATLPASPAPVAAPAAPAPGQPYAGNFDPNNLMSVYNQISRGGVQMYDPSNPGANGYAPLTNSGGVPAPQDSRVTVFPLEGGYSDSGMGGSSIGVDSYAAMGGVSPPPVSSYRPGSAQIFFEHGSSRLSSRDEQTLDQVAEQAKFAPVDRISIEGHASARASTGDPVSDRAANLKESMNRTYSVSRSLMSKGVPAEKIRAVSWGDTRNPPGMPEDQQRRVDVYTGATP